MFYSQYISLKSFEHLYLVLAKQHFQDREVCFPVSLNALFAVLLERQFAWLELQQRDEAGQDLFGLFLLLKQRLL